MSMARLWPLFWQSLATPREIGAWLIGLGLGREVLLLAFGLVLVLQTAFMTTLVTLVDPETMPIPLLRQPLVFMLGLGGMLALFAVLLTWAGRMAGGTAQLEEMGLLLIWLQGLRLALQLAVLVLSFALPALSPLLLMAGTALSFWILVNFVAAAHRFDGLGRALLVLVMAAFGLAMGISILLGMIGATTLGMNGYV
ncbi:hypothetical protein [Litorisediminicola beolgyonensis]|uniref:Yip1 domain protein n=1 Tax=Litorisediminicola beolgyonensis TaxID=1173614 RepID=A0ABW3ZM14_9RHOB